MSLSCVVVCSPSGSRPSLASSETLIQAGGGAWSGDAAVTGGGAGSGDAAASDALLLPRTCGSADAIPWAGLGDRAGALRTGPRSGTPRVGCGTLPAWPPALRGHCPSSSRSCGGSRPTLDGWG